MEDLGGRRKERSYPINHDDELDIEAPLPENTVSPGIYIDSIKKIGKMKKNSRAKSANKYAYTEGDPLQLDIHPNLRPNYNRTSSNQSNEHPEEPLRSSRSVQEGKNLIQINQKVQTEYTEEGPYPNSKEAPYNKSGGRS